MHRLCIRSVYTLCILLFYSCLLYTALYNKVIQCCILSVYTCYTFVMHRLCIRSIYTLCILLFYSCLLYTALYNAVMQITCYTYPSMLLLYSMVVIHHYVYLHFPPISVIQCHSMCTIVMCTYTFHKTA